MAVIPTLNAFLVQAQEKLQKSDHEMAEALGFSRGTVYALIRDGKSKLPLSKVPALARALETPASDVLSIVLNEYEPEVLDIINRVLGPFDLATSEKKLIEAYRILARGQDVEPVIMDGKNIIALITA